MTPRPVALTTIALSIAPGDTHCDPLVGIGSGPSAIAAFAACDTYLPEKRVLSGTRTVDHRHVRRGRDGVPSQEQPRALKGKRKVTMNGNRLREAEQQIRELRSRY